MNSGTPLAKRFHRAPGILLCIGILAGFGIGAAIGATVDNLAAGLLFGAAIGVASGIVLEKAMIGIRGGQHASGDTNALAFAGAGVLILLLLGIAILVSSAW